VAKMFANDYMGATTIDPIPASRPPYPLYGVISNTTP
jgi:hypothetical protein